jgi:hypothetical protein
LRIVTPDFVLSLANRSLSRLTLSRVIVVPETQRRPGSGRTEQHHDTARLHEQIQQFRPEGRARGANTIKYESIMEAEASLNDCEEVSELGNDYAAADCANARVGQSDNEQSRRMGRLVRDQQLTDLGEG